MRTAGACSGRHDASLEGQNEQIEAPSIARSFRFFEERLTRVCSGRRNASFKRKHEQFKALFCGTPCDSGFYYFVLCRSIIHYRINSSLSMQFFR
jgi:hypothetical protein